MSRYWVKRVRGPITEGPYAPERIRAMASRGEITGESLVSEDQEDWVPITNVTGLVGAGQLRSGAPTRLAELPAAPVPRSGRAL